MLASTSTRASYGSVAYHGGDNRRRSEVSFEGDDSDARSSQRSSVAIPEEDDDGRAIPPGSRKSQYQKQQRKSRGGGVRPSSNNYLTGASNNPTAIQPQSSRVMRAINLTLICMGIFFYGICISLYAPFYPPEAEKRQLSSTTVGFIFGIWPLVMFIGCLVTGRLASHLGRRYMVGAGIFLEAGCTILFGVLDQAPHGDAYIVLCFFVRFVEGVGASMYNTASFSTAAQLYPDDIATVYGVLQTADGLGRIVGPTVGGLLYSASNYSFSMPFVVLGSVLMLVGIISLIVLQITLFRHEDKTGTMKKAADKKQLPWIHFYRVSYEIWLLTFSLTATALIAGYSQPTLSVYLFDSLGLVDPTFIGLVFLGGGLAFALLSVIVGKLADTFSRHYFLIMIFGAILLFVSYMLIGPVPTLQASLPPSIELTSACYIMSCAAVSFLMNPVPIAILANARKAGYQEGLEMSAMVASLFNAHWFLGGFLGSPIAGALMDAVGFEWGATIMAMVALVFIVFLIIGYVLKLYNDHKQRQANDRAVLFKSQTVTVTPRPSQWVVAPGV